jgi:3-deoxy-D-arabino-heptulosonate 7-phosphate (DAHP) synthase
MHPDPKEALSDGAQALVPDTFKWLMESLRELSQVTGHRFTR